MSECRRGAAAVVGRVPAYVQPARATPGSGVWWLVAGSGRWPQPQHHPGSGGHSFSLHSKGPGSASVSTYKTITQMSSFKPGVTCHRTHILHCNALVLYISQYLFTQLIRFYFNSLLLLMPSRIVVEKAGCLESGIVAYLLSVSYRERG